MGGDTRVRMGSGLINGVVEKVFFKEDFLFGVCGTVRYLNILKYRFMPPKRCSDISTLEYLNTVFIDEVKKCLMDTKYLEEKDEISRIPENSQILIGYDSNIFNIDPDFCVIKMNDFWAIGSGSDYALGSLEMSKNKTDSRARIEQALNIACKFDSGCSQPFTILEI